MSDIVDELEEYAEVLLKHDELFNARRLMKQATDEIRTLRRDIELMRKGLEFEKRINPNNVRIKSVIDPSVPPNEVHVVGAHERLIIRDVGHETPARAADDGRDAKDPGRADHGTADRPLPPPKTRS